MRFRRLVDRVGFVGVATGLTLVVCLSACFGCSPSPSGGGTELVHQEDSFSLCRNASTLDSLWPGRRDTTSIQFVRYQEHRARTLSDQGKIRESLNVLEQLVECLSAQGRHRELAQLRNSIGELLGQLGDYSRSIQQLHQAYDLALQTDDTTQMLIANNIIAKHCAAIGNYGLAKEYLQRSLTLIGPEDSISDAQAQVYHIYGEMCMGFGQPDLAEEFLGIALNIMRSLGHEQEFVHVMQDLAVAQMSLGKAKDAQQTIRNIQQLLTGDMTSINRLYLHWVMGRYEQAFGEPARAQQAYDSAYRLAMRIGNSTLQIDLLEDLAHLARGIGNKRHAYELLAQADHIRDSLQEFLSSKRFILADLQAAQESRLSEMNRAAGLQEKTYKYTLQRQRVVLIGIILLGGVVVSFLIYLYHIYRNRKLIHDQLVLHKLQIESDQDELSRITNHLRVLRDEKMEQGVQIELMRQDTQRQNDVIMSSIDHAGSIQRAIYPVHEMLKLWLPEYFILLRPRDLVCSVLPWVGRLGKNVMIMALVDCQGRSAAGASLTFIMYMLLYEIVIDNDELDPVTVIRELNMRLARLMANVEDKLKREIQIKIALVSVNIQDRLVDFVGLGSDLYYTLDRIRIERIEGEHGFMDLRDRSLVLVPHRISYSAESVFYMTSDGYLKQVNSQGVRLGQSRFMQILQSVLHLPLEAQEQELLQHHMQHRLGVDQTEDVVVGAFVPPVMLSKGDLFLGK